MPDGTLCTVSVCRDFGFMTAKLAFLYNDIPLH